MVTYNQINKMSLSYTTKSSKSRTKRRRIDKGSTIKVLGQDTIKFCRGDDCFGSLCKHFPNECVMCSKGRAYQIEYCFRCIIEEGMEMSYELCDVDRNYENFRQSHDYGYEDGVDQDITSQHLAGSCKCIYDGVKDFYNLGYMAGVNQYKVSQLS